MDNVAPKCQCTAPDPKCERLLGTGELCGYVVDVPIYAVNMKFARRDGQWWYVNDGYWVAPVEDPEIGRRLDETTDQAPLAPANTTKLYDELLLAVARKVDGETRHQTALRYIRQAEAPAAQNAASYQEAEADG